MGVFVDGLQVLRHEADKLVPPGDTGVRPARPPALDMIGDHRSGIGICITSAQHGGHAVDHLRAYGGGIGLTRRRVLRGRDCRGKECGGQDGAAN